MAGTIAKLSLECSGSFRVRVLPDGRVELELEHVTEQSSGDSDALYDKRGVAERLGASVRTVDNWMRQKRNPLPYIRHAGRPRFRESDVQWWLSQGCSVAARRCGAKTV